MCELLALGFDCNQLYFFKKGFKISIINLKSCGASDPIIKPINNTVKITKECDVVSTSCAYVKPYKTAVVSDAFAFFLHFLALILNLDACDYHDQLCGCSKCHI